MMMETVPSGTVLHGRYRIERVLGSGGFGHVYLAVDLQRNNQPYAIKEYFVTGSSGQAQLQHEAKVLSQLHHPNLPAFQEAFNERGHYFVVLSYIEGHDLTDLIRVARQKNEPIPLIRVLDWIFSVCDAVQFLHTQQPQVIHRDIKPDNIRITHNGTAILVDLGNAKATADGARTLFFIRHQGTPGYAPQEQYPGGTGTDTRSDVYALGATLYFALTAQEPHSVSNRNQAIQQGQSDLPSLQEKLAQNPPEESADPANRQFRVGGPKPARSVHRHIRHLAQLATLPPEQLEQLNRIIKRAMAMKPKDRYPSIADFRDDLRRVRDALATPTPPSPSPSGRVLDPHSTQPDLPMLYEALEAAKNNPPPSSPQSTTMDQTTPSTPQPVPTRTCPRCGQPLAPQASFCPSCGSSLTSAFKVDSSVPAPTADTPNNNKASSPNSISIHDEENTMVVRPQAKAQVHTYTSAAPHSQPRPFVVSPSQTHTISSPAQSQSPSPVSHTPQIPPVSSTPPNNTSVKTTGSILQSKLVLAVTIVILLVLIAVFLFFIISHGHQPSHSLAPWHTLSSIEVGYRVHDVSLKFTSFLQNNPLFLL